jgi:protein-S-isoprenylcysteine O-methyltransferase Ste14
MSAGVLAKTLLFTLLVPGTVAVLLPRWIVAATGGGHAPAGLHGPALLLGAAGLALYLWCALDFARAAGTPAPIDPPKELVARGLYRWSRNPMYVGVLAFVLAQALYAGSTWLLLYAALLFTAFHSFVVFYEEPTLARTFGGAYERYRASTPRWLGRPGSKETR